MLRDYFLKNQIMLYALFWYIATLVNNPEESIQHSEGGESLKTRIK
jgi:hypothetical protein